MINIKVKFEFNPKKCDLPYDPEELRPTKCLKCLEACPHNLLMFRPLKAKDEDGAPIKFEIHMVFKSFANKHCPDCLKCAEICPSQAIKIKV